jgi:hypothetical protein
MTKNFNAIKMIRKIRNKCYEDTKNMTIDEKFNYIEEGAKLGQKRIQDAAATQQKIRIVSKKMFLKVNG